jgi:sigma-B regulation protein RsbU (phosphoserine phosphatase)
MDASGALFGDEQIRAYLGGANGVEARALIDGLVKAVRAFAGDTPQSDDLTMLAVRYLGR